MAYSITSNDDLIFARLQTILARSLSVADVTITPFSSMDNLPQWDSLNFLLVITAVEEEFSIRFGRSDMKSLRSVSGFLHQLKLKGQG